ncbi:MULTISPECIES: diacylglycerol kinase family protein [Alteribacter]|uniref:Diacylglycerol kinase family protein n=1 Tax=Alteribacter keqinensis TaxID=2483800 RepID=A0A3M7TT96_9BACI|nr:MULTISPECIES: diacylglycerol kinase family protein [Alteribacter]MBM7097103.1 diacylglycerol kinase family protein [Alteribacter salitolerans]RNA68870.1 diacylglycerol kinase family protein [Alteribacter keqinensis]
MTSKNKQAFVSWSRLIKSFRYASEGIKHTWANEQNFRIHSILAGIVLIASTLLGVSVVEQALLILVIGGVLGLELINTALERCVDMITKEYAIEAKIIKDVAAGAVMVFSITAVLVGITIFLPKIIALLF